jgi:hypothetical protein
MRLIQCFRTRLCIRIRIRTRTQGIRDYAPMYRYTYAPMYLCTYVPMHLCTYAHIRIVALARAHLHASAHLCMIAETQHLRPRRRARTR